MTLLRLLVAYLRTAYYWPIFWAIQSLALMFFIVAWLEYVFGQTPVIALIAYNGFGLLVFALMCLVLPVRHRRFLKLARRLHYDGGIRPELWEMYADTLCTRRLLLQAARSTGYEASFQAYRAARRHQAETPRSSEP